MVANASPQTAKTAPKKSKRRSKSSCKRRRRVKGIGRRDLLVIVRVL
jgi:hypothetical protein